MPKRITGKTHVGERRERRPNGDIYIYERITAYNEKTKKTYTVSQKLKGKIQSGKQEIMPTRPKKCKGEGSVVDAVRRHTGLTDILEWVGKSSGIDNDILSSFSEGDAAKILSIARYWIGTSGNTLPRLESFKLLLNEKKITQDVVDQIRSWRHSGFSVDKSVALAAGDTAGIERLVQYMVRCPFSLDRIISRSADGKIVYRAEKTSCQPFPILGNERLLKGIPRNFEVFDPLDFIAEITQHIPSPDMQMIRYNGYYSNRARGDRAKARNSVDSAEPKPIIDDEDTPYRKLTRLRWAQLIQRVYEIDPMCCPECGAQMRIISFVGRHNQPEVVDKILNHCGLEGRPASRAPPSTPSPEQLEFEYVEIDEFLMAL